ncbi:hypothetical protein ACFL24_01570 [Patescibacteria group bacterium]
MIYLIGGPPRSGKTIIAKKISKSWISADIIESMVVSYINKKDLKRLFPKSIIRVKTKQSNDAMYNSYSAKEIVKAYIKQARASWKAIETMITCELKEGHDYIIEGHQIHPQLIARIIKKHKKINIVPIILTRFDKDEIVSGCQKHETENDWFIQKTKNKETYYKIAEMISVYSDFFEREAKKYKLKVINMDGDFKKQSQVVVKYLKNA